VKIQCSSISTRYFSTLNIVDVSTSEVSASWFHLGEKSSFIPYDVYRSKVLQGLLNGHNQLPAEKKKELVVSQLFSSLPIYSCFYHFTTRETGLRGRYFSSLHEPVLQVMMVHNIELKKEASQ